MAIEIERKFLCKKIPLNASSSRIVNAYLFNWHRLTIRLRTIDNKKAKLTIKGKNSGISRPEFECKFPFKLANFLITKFRLRNLAKIRHELVIGNHKWEVDEFLGENKGLIVAEIELGSVDEEFEKPDWAGKEVSDDPRYYNSILIDDPYEKWKPK